MQQLSLLGRLWWNLVIVLTWLGTALPAWAGGGGSGGGVRTTSVDWQAPIVLALVQVGIVVAVQLRRRDQPLGSSGREPGASPNS